LTYAQSFSTNEDRFYYDYDSSNASLSANQCDPEAKRPVQILFDLFVSKKLHFLRHFTRAHLTLNNENPTSFKILLHELSPRPLASHISISWVSRPTYHSLQASWKSVQGTFTHHSQARGRYLRLLSSQTNTFHPAVAAERAQSGAVRYTGFSIWCCCPMTRALLRIFTPVTVPAGAADVHRW
jgi:hypothetical protein